MPKYHTGESVIAAILSLQSDMDSPSYTLAINEAVSAVNLLPAENVCHVSHSKWIFDCERTAGDGWTYRQYHCEKCGFQMLGGIHNFCPNCGAKMDKEA